MTLLFFITPDLPQREQLLLLSLANYCRRTLAGYQIFAVNTPEPNPYKKITTLAYRDAIRICRLSKTISIFPTSEPASTEGIISNPLSWSFSENGESKTDIIQTENVLCLPSDDEMELLNTKKNSGTLTLTDFELPDNPHAILVDENTPIKDLRMLLNSATLAFSNSEFRSIWSEALIRGCSLDGDKINKNLLVFPTKVSNPDIQTRKYRKTLQELEGISTRIKNHHLNEDGVSQNTEGHPLTPGTADALWDENNTIKQYLNDLHKQKPFKVAWIIHNSFILTNCLRVFYIVFILFYLATKLAGKTVEAIFSKSKG